MLHSNCSEASWTLANVEERSNSSWQLEGAQGNACAAGDLDLRSDMSWDLLTEQDQCATPRSVRSVPCTRVPTTRAPPAAVDLELPAAEATNAAGLISLIRENRPEAALHAVRRQPQIAQVADGEETVLSWAVYKARCSKVAWLELICELLIHQPADVRKRNSYNFLPLHDAAWGNAPAAVGILLCAVFPAAAHMAARGQTPHQVGDYHHSSRRSAFSWPDQTEMVAAARALACEPNLLTNLATAGLSTYPSGVLHAMSAADIHHQLGVSEAMAALIKSFLTEPQVRAPQWVCGMPSIPEMRAFAGLSRSRSHIRPRRSGYVFSAPEVQTTKDENVLPELASDDLFVREQCSKNTSHNAGIRRARNSRCSFQDFMVVDNGDTKFHLSMHSVRSMPAGQEKKKEPKWPTKVVQTLERKRERAFKQALMGA